MTPPLPIHIHQWQSPVGEMMLGEIGEKVCLCDWAAERHRDTIDRRICRILNAEYVEGETPTIQKMVEQLQEYFAGMRMEFELPLQFAGTEFQCCVWAELMKIPYGTTISYGDLALRIGNIKAVRAVASATATNPISIFVPCHRVIGSNNHLTGYAGGLPAKRALLSLEGSIESNLPYASLPLL